MNGYYLDDHHWLHRRSRRQIHYARRQRAIRLHHDDDPWDRGRFRCIYLGRALGWYSPGEGAGLIGAVVGAIIVLFVYGLITSRRTT